MARKREERAVRNAQRAARKVGANQGSSQDHSFVSLKQQLVAMGLTQREIPGDGNCLFRALGDQLDGTTTTHHKHRHQVVDYMRLHRADFEPFVEDDVPFERHCNNLAELGTYAGNDCIVAFARLHQVSVVIHQLNTPCWQVNGTEVKKGMVELHISYHNGDHYNSVRRMGDLTASPACIKLATTTTIPTSITPKASIKEEEDNDEDEDEEEEEEEESMANGQMLDGPVHHRSSALSCKEPRWAEHAVMEQTGCDNLALVQRCLHIHDFNVREAVDAIINYIVLQHKETAPGCSNGQLWSTEGIEPRLFAGGAGSPRAPTSLRKTTQQEKIQQRLRTQQHLSNSKRKELKKQLRKQQANDRKRQQHASQVAHNLTSEDSEVILVKDIGCLSI